MNNPEPTYLLIRETDYTYDDYEELVSADTTYAYDAAGRLVEQVVTEYDLDERNEEETPISVFRKECYERDAAGNVVKRLVHDETGALTKYVTADYDPRDHKTRECYFKLDGSLIYCFIHAYDEAGRHVRQEWRAADDTLRDYRTWTYDDAGRVLQEEQGGAEGVARETIRCEYDAEGRQVNDTDDLSLAREQLTQAWRDFGLLPTDKVAPLVARVTWVDEDIHWRRDETLGWITNANHSYRNPENRWTATDFARWNTFWAEVM